MNRQTRTFIWGLILLSIGMFLIIIDFHHFEIQTTKINVGNVLSFCIDLLISYNGFVKVHNTTN